MLAPRLTWSHSVYMDQSLATYGTAQDLLAMLSKPSATDKALVSKAYNFAFDAHKAHERLSGEPYFNHLYATAASLAELDMDAATVAAGLLHDIVEDTPVTHAELEKEFGPEVTRLVDGVTKLGTLKYRGAQRHVESLRRLFVASSQDIRVIMIKFMDRRHNMQTLDHVPPDKRSRIANETLFIYAPLADRLGMGRLKGELEDLAFKYVYPDEYARMQEIMRESKIAREPQLEKIARSLKRALVEHNIQGYRTESRIKGYYSLFRKLERKDGDLEKIHDLLAIRVILGTVEDCYRALGVVHALWHPLPGKIKDYIAFPKPNGYRSIHTTVVTPEAGPVEVQLRTEAMHHDAQFGLASHLSYKETVENGDRGEQKRNRLWYKQLIPSLLRTQPATPTGPEGNVPRWVSDLANAHEVETSEAGDLFMQEIREDFFSHRIFIFTPKGDVVDLPLNSSPVDFAYAIHSEIGDHMAGAKVNGKLVALDTSLKNGDIVEIDTRPTAKPSAKWLEYARTTMARRHIQQYLGQREREKEK